MPNALGSVMRIPTENLLIQCILSKKNNTSWLQCSIATVSFQLTVVGWSSLVDLVV